MTERLPYVLKRIDSRHLAELWNFYRDYFTDDDSCLGFIHASLANEPENNSWSFSEIDEEHGIFVSDNGTVVHDSVFIPRRMMNAVVRLVTAARDMEQIRRGKDIFKVVFLITCAETLQKLSGKAGYKKDLVFSFFEGYTSEDDKKYIAKHFAHDDEEVIDQKEDSFKQFVGVLNEYRNCATHEGEYWDFCFANHQDGYSLLLPISIDLENFSSKNKKSHCFCTSINYRDFESVFVRTCIRFIEQYTKGIDNHAVVS